MMYHLTLLAHNVQAAGYTCPKSRNDFWSQIEPAANIIVGDIIGLKPLVIVVIIGLVVSLVIAAAVESARKTIFRALVWVVAASVLGGVVITLASSLLGNFGC